MDKKIRRGFWAVEVKFVHISTWGTIEATALLATRSAGVAFWEAAGCVSCLPRVLGAQRVAQPRSPALRAVSAAPRAGSREPVRADQRPAAPGEAEVLLRLEPVDGSRALRPLCRVVSFDGSAARGRTSLSWGPRGPHGDLVLPTGATAAAGARGDSGVFSPERAGGEHSWCHGHHAHASITLAAGCPVGQGPTQCKARGFR